MKRGLISVLGCLGALSLAASAMGQASLTASGYSQNFDALGTAGTAHLPGWATVQFNFGSNSTWGTVGVPAIPASGTNSVASGTLSATQTLSATTVFTANSSSQARNYALPGSTADRALGLAPTTIAGLGLQLSLNNDAGAPVTEISLSYDIRRFTAPGAANELPGYWLFYSLDNGTTWTNVAALNPTIAGPGGVIVPNTVGVTTVPATTVAFPSALAAGGNLRLRWVDDNADQSSPDQIYGLDNLAITVTLGSLDGRCCSTIDGSCVIANSGGCAAGSTFLAGVVCDPNTCPPPPSGSCCGPDGSCLVTLQSACTAAWTVSGVCVPNTCTVTVASLGAGGYAQDFNALGASGTAVPGAFTFWTVAGDRPTFEEVANGGTGVIDAPAVGTATQVTSPTTLAAFTQSGTAAPSTRNAGYNFGFSAAPDNRLLGVSPTGNGASFIQLRLRNDTGGPLSSITFTYDFRVMSAWTGNELAGYRFFYSTAGAAGPWTPVPALDGVATSVNVTGETITESAVITPAQAIAAGGEILVRWGDDNGNASPDQAYGIDNIVVAPLSGTPVVCCNTDGGCVLLPPGSACDNPPAGALTCEPNPCPQPPSGSCCAADGSCTVVRQSACAGTWTLGGACQPNICPGPVVACCLTDGSCVTVPQDQCAGFSAGFRACSTTALCRQPGTTRFVVFGDHGVDGANQAAVAARLKEYNPEFIATTGDNTYFTNADVNNYDRTQAKYYGQFIKLPAGSAYLPGAASNAFFPTMGNHDFDISGTAAGAIAYWNSYWDLPGNERYYAFTRGPIEFFMLSSDGREPDGDTVGSVQQQWFAQRVAASTATFKLAFFHHPAYTYPSNHGPDTAMRAWNFGAAGINAVFSGHNHNLQRIEAEGIPFFVSGAGGNSLYSINGTVAGGAFASSSFGFHLIDATPTQITIRCIDVSGAILDTRVINAPTGACCRAAACTVLAQALCTGPSSRFAGVGSVCNAAGNNVQPCCRADFDQSGVRDVSDIFAFLSAWFGDSPQADLDGNGRNVQDIFSFLSLWFGGC